MNIVQQYKPNFDKVIDHLKHDITGLRTGRATPAIVEDVPVEAYGTKQPLKAVASISAPDAKTLTVDPWDKSLMQPIEIAIRNSSVGINPVNDGTLIRLPLPDLTEERRIELIKVLNQKMEQARISIRKTREDVRNAIDVAIDSKEISEDEKFKMQDELEKIVKEYNEKIREIGEEKEVEIKKV